jgi:hypothetical protein
LSESFKNYPTTNDCKWIINIFVTENNINMISVNKVRNTVLFLLNKANRGTIGVIEFDAFCHLAQMDLFENLFYRLNKWTNNQTKKYTNSEYADIVQNIQEQIDVFATYSTVGNFTYNAPNNVWSYTGGDFYRTEGLTLINPAGKRRDVQEIHKGYELNSAINSSLNPPSVTYPIYTKIGLSYRVYPTVASGYSLELFYIRTPKAPKWSYLLVQGNPVYNASASDKQDFELSEVMFPLLVAKIMGYCGVSIREQDVAAIADNEEVKTENKQS